ncbi:MAG: sulfite exporter TauE/SafE family protein [Acidaminococcus sp.]|jgi:uncharacterized membrane protein YfcA|nr:sulfite exporter TauE/SafE family protein [Acidaminococcus sp.]MCI2100845.1 sulfite exporter TauE/SafE family protein [Acidaminococcus sp.]MCI2115208.1 sulfite exporter TauE/SafE family protein [Acidaminococcus sp.]MCI2116659.1 sulfite exporter TauE/SafE family protein [Acidaminococcus sp.]
MVNIMLLLIAFLSSVIGNICGVGGGVFMKPVVDLSGIASVSLASFLSGVTVLAMTGYSTFKNLSAKNNTVNVSAVAPLSLGAAVGGVVGKYLFEMIKSQSAFPDRVGAVQAVCLGLVVLGTALYTLCKKNIRTLHLQNRITSVIIGVVLGIFSSFLGIGGGPIDLVVLQFFFSMPTKMAVQNSLFTILFSQIFSLIYTVASGNVPEFQVAALVLMIAGGIAGGAAGRKISKDLSGEVIDKLFIGLLAVILLICVRNFFKYV